MRPSWLARDWLWMESQLESLELGTWNLELWNLELWIFAALARTPLALRRLAVWKAMTRAASGRPVSFRHVEAALQLIEASDGRVLDVPLPNQPINQSTRPVKSWTVWARGSS